MMEVMTELELESRISKLPGEKVTAEYITSRIKTAGFIHTPDAPTLTICTIVMDNGFTAVGHAACVDPANYDAEIGKNLSYKHAFNQLWPLFGFLLAEMRHIKELHNLRLMNEPIPRNNPTGQSE